VIAVVSVGFWYLEGDRIMAVLKPNEPAHAALAVTPVMPPAPAPNGAANSR
jgi:hypothetical protein